MIVSAARIAIVVSPVQLNGCPKATALPLHTKVVVPIPAVVTSPRDMAAANESPARRCAVGGGGLLDADEPMYAMNGRPCRSIAACMLRRPRSVRPEAESGVFRRDRVAVCVMERPLAADMRAASARGTATDAVLGVSSPIASTSYMS